MLATEHQTETAVYEAMLQLDDAFVAEPQLKRSLSNPAVSDEDKIRLVMTACGLQGAAADEVKGFVTLLLRNRRLETLHQCALAYVRLYRVAKHIYKVSITSAASLLPEELQRIKTLVERQLPAGATADFSESVNPDLIGGFTVSIDNELLDASVASELKQLRLKLLSH